MFNSPTQQAAYANMFVNGSFTHNGNTTQVGHQTVVQERPDFDNDPLDHYAPPAFKGPLLTPHLVAHLTDRDKRFLILSGNPVINTEALAKHVAACLLQTLAAGNEKTEAKVWRRTGDLAAVESELQKVEKPTVLILPQLSGYPKT